MGMAMSRPLWLASGGILMTRASKSICEKRRLKTFDRRSPVAAMRASSRLENARGAISGLGSRLIDATAGASPRNSAKRGAQQIRARQRLRVAARPRHAPAPARRDRQKRRSTKSCVTRAGGRSGANPGRAKCGSATHQA